MKTASSVKRTVKVAALTVAFTASGSAMALAGTHTTSGNNSILGGNQINAPISIPVDICGNAAAILGTSLAGCEGGASVAGTGGGGTWTTSGNNSIGGGNQINAPISVPVNACGNSISAVGTALSGCKGGASVGHTGGGTWTTSGNNSIGGGNQINAPISVPVNVCGNAASALGVALAGCEGGASVGTPPSKHHHPTPPPCKHHHPTPPKHHHHPTPPGHHRHHGGGGSGTTTTSMQLPGAGGSLPTTGANILGLLALAGAATLSGAGSILLVARRGLRQGLVAFTRRAAHAVR